MILDARGKEVNGNGADLTERQKAKIRAQTCTIGEANDMAHAHAVAAVNHLGNQIPALIHRIVSEAIQGYHAALIARGVIPAEAPVIAPVSEEVSENAGEYPAARDSNAPATEALDAVWRVCCEQRAASAYSRIMRSVYADAPTDGNGEGA